MPVMKHKWINRKSSVKLDNGNKRTTEWIECEHCGKRPENNLSAECRK